MLIFSKYEQFIQVHLNPFFALKSVEWSDFPWLISTHNYLCRILIIIFFMNVDTFFPTETTAINLSGACEDGLHEYTVAE